MTLMTRRSFAAATASCGLLAACSDGGGNSAAAIDARVAASRALLFQSVPGTETLAERAAGVLVIPDIIEGGFVVSGAYGEGSLQIGDATVDYMSLSAAAVGFQIGAQRYAQALFFMTKEILRDFRVADGWELGVDAEFAVFDEAAVATGVSTRTINAPVYSVI
ncbi:MAG: twin-arginine translocation pathway signal, partial [Pseudomonadota bacterium]